MRYLSVCSGYCAATVAWRELGWQPAGFSEIEPFPRAVLEQRHGAVPVGWDFRYLPGRNAGPPLFGDFTQIEAHHVGPIDLLVGGTPCQSFSYAGKRLGLDDPRGNLTLEFLALAKRLRPRWLAWENVPGVLSHDDGRTLGTFLWLLGELGYRWAYRVLDAQWVRVPGHPRAVPQRRRRVFVVGYLGEGPHPGAVLFEPESLRGDPAPRREAWQGIAQDVAPCLVSSGRGVERTGDTRGQDPVVAVFGAEVAPTLDASFSRLQGCAGQDVHHGHGHLISQPIAATLTRGAESAGKGGYAGRRREDDINLVAHSLRAEGFDASEDGTGRGTPIVPVHAFDARQSDVIQYGDISGPMDTKYPGPTIAEEWRVRRLTPMECERLMGVPDGFTAITYRGKPAADGPRYKVLGNSMAVNVMRWLGHSIQQADDAWSRAA
jgi:DNA (cytosine-5)-methyltransferase 1